MFKLCNFEDLCVILKIIFNQILINIIGKFLNMDGIPQLLIY